MAELLIPFGITVKGTKIYIKQVQVDENIKVRHSRTVGPIPRYSIENIGEIPVYPSAIALLLPVASTGPTAPFLADLT
jgi:hypothetical protein